MSKRKTQPAIGPVEDGVFGSTTVSTESTKTPKIKPASTVTKVAIHSTRNVSWSEVGTVSIGYNIVTEAQAEKWLTRNHTRLATPEEVAGAYNK